MQNVTRKSVAACAAALSAAMLASCCCHERNFPWEHSDSIAQEETTLVPAVATTYVAPPPPVIPPRVVTPPVVPPRVDKKPEPPKRVEPVQAVERADRKPIRIQAGSVINWKDKQGHEWLADAGFSEGAMLNRGEVSIEKTDTPELYKSERTNMEKFSWPVPIGKYTLKLHFSENMEDVKKAGERVFSIEAMGEKITNLDIFKEAGGANKALIKTLKVTATKGKIEINFIKTEQKEPLINGIEILPE